MIQPGITIKEIYQIMRKKYPNDPITEMEVESILIQMLKMGLVTKDSMLKTDFR